MPSMGLGLGLVRSGAGSTPINFFNSFVFSTASLDLNFAESKYRQSVGGEVFTSPSSITGWSYSRTGTRTVLNVAGESINFGPNIPAITDRGIFVGSAAEASGADVMPTITRSELGSNSTIYAEFYRSSTPASDNVIWALNGNNPGYATNGAIRPNGSISNNSANYRAIVKTAFSYTVGVNHSYASDDGQQIDDDLTIGGTVSGKTFLGVGRYATSTAFGQSNTYIKRLSIFPRRFGTEALRVLTIQPGLVLAGVGDSIMKGDGVNEFLPIVAASLGSDVFAPNYGVNGQSWVYDWPSDPAIGTMVSDHLNKVSELLEVPTQRGHKMIAFAGTNGIVLKGNSAAQEYADFETWITTALSSGWTASNITICTMLPRTGVSEVTRSDYNALLVSGAATYGYKLARFDLDSTIGAAGANTNTTYFSDGTHPTNAGHAILANILIAVI